MKKLIFLFIMALLYGCAINSGVVPIGKDTFMVSRQAATGFFGSAALKAEAFQEASLYCTSQGKYLQVLNTRETAPPYILSNYPKAEIEFMCLDANDTELQRPKMKRDSDIIIENRQNP